MGKSRAKVPRLQSVFHVANSKLRKAKAKRVTTGLKKVSAARPGQSRAQAQPKTGSWGWCKGGHNIPLGKGKPRVQGTCLESAARPHPAANHGQPEVLPVRGQGRTDPY